MGLLDSVEARNSDRNVTEFKPGDTVRVQVRIVEGEKQRLQAFQGIVIQRKGAGVRETFTVRRVTGGIGVERIFALRSPNVSQIEVLRRGRTRRARLYYLRDRKGKAAQVKERRN
ncbi:MAG: 50S ribosomal protein L19 [Candidatus Eisenbacteria sp.]|nr:50S ribosomal protein L19 [Candidatus Eisenbacteria bacterium]